MNAKALLAIAALVVLAGCSSGGPTRPSSPPDAVIAPLVIRWQPVTQNTDGEPSTDIVRYEITVTMPGVPPTTIAEMPDTGEVIVPVPSKGTWTVRVTAVSASLGAGEPAEAQVVR